MLALELMHLLKLQSLLTIGLIEPPYDVVPGRPLQLQQSDILTTPNGVTVRANGLPMASATRRGDQNR
jgi:hypothetical protein